MAQGLAAFSSGSANNDSFYNDADRGIIKITNNAGGILGGISDGSDIIVRAAVKPTPSIASLQHTINKTGDNIDIEIKGRHDPVIVPRAVVVVEAMVASVIFDMLMASMFSNIGLIKKFFNM